MDGLGLLLAPPGPFLSWKAIAKNCGAGMHTLPTKACLGLFSFVLVET
jgi:hypothetical protein